MNNWKSNLKHPQGMSEKDRKLAKKARLAGNDVVYIHPYGISERKTAVESGFKFREITDEELK